MIRSIKVFSLFAFAFVLYGCATIFSGTSEEVSITTSPSDATIYVNDRVVGSGSAAITVSRTYANNERPFIRVARDGYVTQEFRMTNSFNSVSILNLSSVYSWTTDFISGAMFEYAPNQYHVQLVKVGSAGAMPGKYKLERYVLMNFEVIKTDLSRGYGEYFTALTEFYSDTAEAANILHENKQMLLETSSPMALSDALAKLLL